MANPKSLKPWPKGTSGNPEGARKHNPLRRAIKKLTADDFAMLASLVIQGDLESLRKIAKDPASTVLKVMIASVSVKSIEKGDMNAIDLLLNRLIGKVPTPMQLSTPPGEAIIVNPKTEEEKRLDREAQLARINELASRIKAVKLPE